MKISSKLTFLTVLVFILFSCSNTGELDKAEYGFLAPKHGLQPNKEYEVLWDVSNISVTELSSLPPLVGAPKKIIVQGMEKDSLPRVQVFALDSSSGNFIWKIDGKDWGHIIAQDDVLYRGTGGTATVQAFNIENAELLWSTRLPWAHSTSDMHFSENKIFIYTNDDEFFVLNAQGEILDNYRETYRIFLETNGVIYMEDDLSIKAIDSSTNQEVWQVDVDEPYYNSPIFDNGTIFIRTYSIPTKIYSINQTSGKVDWNLSQNVTSNLCILNDKVYFTSLEGYLVALDRYSGEEISKVKFSTKIDLDKLFRNYFITCDSSNNVLAISFGDNTQIMGLKVVNP